MFLTVRYKQGNPQAAVVEDRSGKLETRILRELDNITQVRCKVGISLHTRRGIMLRHISKHSRFKSCGFAKKTHTAFISYAVFCCTKYDKKIQDTKT